MNSITDKSKEQEQKINSIRQKNKSKDCDFENSSMASYRKNLSELSFREKSMRNGNREQSKKVFQSIQNSRSRYERDQKNKQKLQKIEFDNIKRELQNHSEIINLSLNRTRFQRSQIATERKKYHERLSEIKRTTDAKFF
eukprot:CAMPEP_0170562292 /NCGR_PEP_ID=MMETSP0211-20121228/59780_1 /TAXON_ID=311385 /ORGANISM="Pseudokeronopsis sp., Strain OXSARD2" /LENGTH=139 /DNA_ID=CAMNT_0010878977 /DNA_START=459 /DNA_END=881 /DNA_ORIENTATION=-